MGTTTEGSLLGPDDPGPVEVLHARGKSPFVICCDHAGHAVPAGLGGLGVDPRELDRHIAWDIGAALTARSMSASLDAPCVLQHFSRLVIDCNRPATRVDRIPEVSDGTRIPANEGLTPDEREARVNEIFSPYHQAIRTLLDERSQNGPAPILFSLHSFTPQLTVTPEPRPWQLGLLYGRDDRVALRFESALAVSGRNYVVGHNQPYAMGVGLDYTIPEHGESRGIPHMMIEIRNDLIDTPDRASDMGEFIAGLLAGMDASF